MLAGSGAARIARLVVFAGLGTLALSSPGLALPPSSIDVDYDNDTDVDGSDLAVMAGCRSGANVPPPPGCAASSDLDLDGDVDGDDFGIFQRCISGDGLPAAAECVTFMSLEEQRFTSVDQGIGQFPGPNTPMPESTFYHHLDLVTPLVQIDDAQTVLTHMLIEGADTDVVHIAGRVLCTVDLMNSPGAQKVLVLVNGEVVTPDPQRRFTADVPREGPHTVVRVTACNALGGCGYDSVEVDGEVITPQPHTSDAPAIQRINFGSLATAGALVGVPITLELTSPLHGVVDQIEVQTLTQLGNVVTERFIISEQDEIRYRRRRSRTPISSSCLITICACRPTARRWAASHLRASASSILRPIRSLRTRRWTSSCPTTSVRWSATSRSPTSMP
jgi:hypothetical protein